MGELRKQIEIQNPLMEELEREIREHTSMVKGFNHYEIRE